VTFVAMVAIAAWLELGWHVVFSQQIWKQHYSLCIYLDLDFDFGGFGGIKSSDTIILYYLRITTIKIKIELN
jgi:hypothetical protein